MRMLRLLRGSARRFSGMPSQTDYFKLAVEDLDIVFGPKRVESSRIEAAARRIAQKLFLSESAERAMIEQEIQDDETKFTQQLDATYLRDLVDARDKAPRPLPTSQTKVAKELRHALQSKSPSVVNDVARILWQHPVRRQSIYMMVSREMLKLGYGSAAQEIMMSLLMMTKKKPSRGGQTTSENTSSGPSSSEGLLGNSAYTLCLELAMSNGDHKWFMELSNVAMNRPSPYKQKFDLSDGDPRVELLLAEGFMKFGHPHLLDEVLKRNRDVPSYVKLLTVSMEMAARYGDEARALWTFAQFRARFDPTREATVRFLLLARKHGATKNKAAELVPKLSAQKQKLYKMKEPVWQYIHPYANNTHTHADKPVYSTHIAFPPH